MKVVFVSDYHIGMKRMATDEEWDAYNAWLDDLRVRLKDLKYTGKYRRSTYNFSDVLYKLNLI